MSALTETIKENETESMGDDILASEYDPEVFAILNEDSSILSGIEEVKGITEGESLWGFLV